MKKSPRKVIFNISRLVLVLAAAFSGANIVFGLLNWNRLMPMALTMTGYLTRAGVQMSSSGGTPFYAIYCAALAGIVCIAFLLGVLLAGRNTGWLLSSAIIFLVDCAGIAVLFALNGYRSGYWFELAGHAVIFVVLIVAFCSLPRKKRLLTES